MNKYGEITLLTISFEKDAIGQAKYRKVDERTIQCKVDEITRSEWIVAKQAGYNPDAMVEVFSASYNGEQFAEYNGKTFEIYRTFQNGDKTELYLSEKVGTQREMPEEQP